MFSYLYLTPWEPNVITDFAIIVIYLLREIGCRSLSVDAVWRDHRRHRVFRRWRWRRSLQFGGDGLEERVYRRRQGRRELRRSCRHGECRLGWWLWGQITSVRFLGLRRHEWTGTLCRFIVLASWKYRRQKKRNEQRVYKIKKSTCAALFQVLRYEWTWCLCTQKSKHKTNR